MFYTARGHTDFVTYLKLYFKKISQQNGEVMSKIKAAYFFWDKVFGEEVAIGYVSRTF